MVSVDGYPLANDNNTELETKKYEYILGARIKNESAKIKQQILAIKFKNGQSHIINKDEPTRLIISYSLARAKKDKANRQEDYKN